MLTLRPKTKQIETTNPLRAILSVNVPQRKKIRPPKYAHNDFFRPTYDVLLFPNIISCVSDLPDACRSLASIWREISNRDIYYERRKGNLPAYFGTRFMCVEFSEKDLTPSLLTDIALTCKDVDTLPSNLACYPYMRIRVDSLQIATFIMSKWLWRTGQCPTQINWTYERVKAGKKYIAEDSERCQLCDPFRIEKIVEDLKPLRVRLGSACTLLCTPQPERPEHVYNIPFTRVTQNIGESVQSLRQKTEKRCIDKVSGLLNQAEESLDRFTRRYSEWITDRHYNMVSRHKRRYFSRMGMWNAYKYYNDSYASSRYRSIGAIADFDAEKADRLLASLACPDVLYKYTEYGTRFPKAHLLVAKHKELFAICSRLLEEQKEKATTTTLAGVSTPVELPIDEQIQYLEALIRRTRSKNKAVLQVELAKLKERKEKG